MDKKNPSVVNIVKKDLHNIIMELDKPIQFYPLGVNKIQGRGSSLIVEIYLKAQEPNENP
jgi:hypothetical protein